MESYSVKQMHLQSSERFMSYLDKCDASLGTKGQRPSTKFLEFFFHRQMIVVVIVALYLQSACSKLLSYRWNVYDKAPKVSHKYNCHILINSHINTVSQFFIIWALEFKHNNNNQEQVDSYITDYFWVTQIISQPSIFSSLWIYARLVIEQNLWLSFVLFTHLHYSESILYQPISMTAS